MNKGTLIQGALLLGLILGVIALIAPFFFGLLFCLGLLVLGCYLWKVIQHAGISKYFHERLDILFKVPEVYMSYKSVSVYGIRAANGVKVFITYKGITTQHSGQIHEVVPYIMHCVVQMETEQTSKRKFCWR